VTIALVAALALAGCSGSAPDPVVASRSSVPASVTPCQRAWRDFAAIDDFHDRVRAAAPTFRACRSVEEWIDVGGATPGHRLIPNRATAVEICRYEPGVRSSAVCRSL
jgi:hypothetical protein